MNEENLQVANNALETLFNISLTELCNIHACFIKYQETFKKSLTNLGSNFNCLNQESPEVYESKTLVPAQQTDEIMHQIYNKNGICTEEITEYECINDSRTRKNSQVIPMPT